MRIDWHCECGDAESSHSSKPGEEVCYGHCQRTERDCGNRGYRPIRHSLRPTAFTAMLAEAEARFLPKAYTCDLSTDYQSLVGRGGKLLPEGGYQGRFVWVLRTNGTEFYRLDRQGPTDLRGSRASLTYWAKDSGGESHVYLWNGYTLGEISADAAIEHINQALAEAGG